MPKTKYIAVAPDGTEFKRTTASRVYTHMVTGRRSKEHALTVAKGASWYGSDLKNWDYANAKVTGAIPWYDFESEASRQRDRDHVAEGREAYAERLKAERIAKVEKDNFDKWLALGWCGRVDLAEKLVGQNRAKSYWAEVRILEAVQL